MSLKDNITEIITQTTVLHLIIDASQPTIFILGQIRQNTNGFRYTLFNKHSTKQIKSISTTYIIQEDSNIKKGGISLEGYFTLLDANKKALKSKPRHPFKATNIPIKTEVTNNKK